MRVDGLLFFFVKRVRFVRDAQNWLFLVGLLTGLEGGWTVHVEGCIVHGRRSRERN